MGCETVYAVGERSGVGKVDGVLLWCGLGLGWLLWLVGLGCGGWLGLMVVVCFCVICGTLVCAGGVVIAGLTGSGCSWVAVPSSIKEIVPASAMPVFDSAGSDVAHIAASFTGCSETTLVLSKAIRL